MTAERLLTPREASALLGVGVVTLSRWADAGTLRSARTLGGHRRFPEADVLVLRARRARFEALRSDTPRPPELAIGEVVTTVAHLSELVAPEAWEARQVESADFCASDVWGAWPTDRMVVARVGAAAALHEAPTTRRDR